MSQMIDGTITLTPGWTNLAVAQPSLANADSVIQNIGPASLRVFYGASASAPASPGSGIVIGVGGIWGGNAANIWVQPVGDTTTITAGLA